MKDLGELTIEELWATLLESENKQTLRLRVIQNETRLRKQIADLKEQLETNIINDYSMSTNGREITFECTVHTLEELEPMAKKYGPK